MATGSSPGPTGTVGPTAATGHQNIRNLAISSALRAELTAAFVVLRRI
jgi:hypothetical protein